MLRMSHGGEKRPLLVILISLITIVLTAAISFNLSPYLRGPDEWQWPYAVLGEPQRMILPIIWLGVHIGLGVWWVRTLMAQPQKRVGGYLWFMWLSAVLIQTTLLYVTTPVIQQLYFRTVSVGANGVFSVGSTINNPHDFLRHYPELMPTFPIHPQRYPPGLMMLFYGMRQFMLQMPNVADSIAQELRLLQCTDWSLMRMHNVTMSTAVLQMSLPLLSSLVVFPLYYLGELTVKRPAALWAVLIYPMIPSFALWIAVWDQFYPLLTVTAWLCLAAGLMHGRRGLIFLGGLVLSFGTFLSFGLVGLLAPMGLWALFFLLAHGDWRIRRFWQNASLNGALFLAGVASLWGVYQAVYGVSFMQVWNRAMGYHFSLEYDYWKWVFYHSYDFLLFLGVPVAILMVTSCFVSVRQWREPQKHLLPLAFGLGLLVLIFSGTSRGEVARVWLFLTPFAVLVGAYVLGRLRLSAAVWLMVLLAGQLLVFNANLRMMTTGMLDPIPYERQFSMPEIENPLSADFGQELTLLGYEVAPAEDDQINVTLYWRAQDFIHTPYTVFIHVLDKQGNLVAQQDSMPQAGGWPTTCWRPDEIVTDRHSLTVTSGNYELVMGLYWFETGERLLPLTDSPEALPDGRLRLGSLTLE